METTWGRILYLILAKKLRGDRRREKEQGASFYEPEIYMARSWVLSSCCALVIGLWVVQKGLCVWVLGPQYGNVWRW